MNSEAGAAPGGKATQIGLKEIDPPLAGLIADRTSGSVSRPSAAASAEEIAWGRWPGAARTAVKTGP
jgi:hypothetical protein